MIQEPAILLPEKLDESITSVLQLNISQIFISNDNDTSTNKSSDVSRTDIFVSGIKLLLLTLEVKKNIHKVLKCTELIKPMNSQV